MKKVFFIGKFNAFYEEMNQFLSGYFNVQVCVDNASMVKGMIKLNQPDIVIVSLMEMEAQKVAILKELKTHYPDIPKLCIGTEDGVFYELKKKNPNKKFYKLNDRFVCQDMKLVTLEKIKNVLETFENQVEVNEDVRAKALKPLENMLELAK